MVSQSFLAVAAVAIGLLGAEASPCRPTTVASLSETSSTVVSLPETTTLTSLAETTLTTVDVTTSTVLEETTSTTVAASTTTTEAPGCVETQILQNPGFDNGIGASPWQTESDVDANDVFSGTRALSFRFNNGGGSGSLAQNLPTLDGDYELSYRWKVVHGTNVGGGFSCSIEPKIGDSTLFGAYPYDFDGWNLDTQTWSSGGDAVTGASLSFSVTCSGEYDSLIINLDDVTLTRVCGEASR
ncbi:hypothetical protein FLONG3_8498 [Fusarium longipes]|uniref:CBM-cenC domain-containing protein n=1 Tax=Fusarium longipes TaxID=694270 RepID=A0A395S5G4_9HYPO|nr:hypothetical protein FLONG3_8498 [Fusarium longipes]